MDVFQKIVGSFFMDALRPFQAVGVMVIVVVAMPSAPVSWGPSPFKAVSARFAEESMLINADCSKG